MKCPKCNHENREEAKFCEACGAKLQLACPKCGSELRSQARFCDNCGAEIGETTPIAGVTIPKLEDMHTQLKSLIPDELAQKYMTAEQQAGGENRPITALFADISGFTPLSATKSSEDMFQLVQDCFKRLVGIVARYEGSISGFRGDGLLALFGAPILHENDAERAILSAIDMRNMMQDKGLQVSIGINTAMMTVGEIQTELHKEYTAYGTDVNLAARLQQIAEPGQILVGAGTHRLTHRAFDFETISDLMLKGFSQTVTAYTVQHVKQHPEKLRGIEGLRARMIGREREFTDIKESADSLISGRGSIATIIGEAGIGKSRLVSELKLYVANKHTPDPSNTPLHPSQEGSLAIPPLEKGGRGDLTPQILEGRCISIGQTISYWAFLDMLRSYLNLSDTDTEPQIAEKIRESISSLFPQRQDDYLPFLGNLLSVKFGDELDSKLRYFTPEQIRHQTLMRLKDIFVAISHTKPLLLILEDLHWADDLSLDLIVLLMDELIANPLMLLCIYRPEQDHRCWQLGGMAFRKCPDRYTEITLKKLSQTQSRQLVESLLEIDNLPEVTKAMIMTKSEGNPFFIEELIRSLIDMELIYHEGDRWKARKEIDGIDVPDTIQSVLLSRVDRLNAETKYVLQCASVIGRLFRYRLLDHIARHERDLETHLTELESKDLINAERTVPELEYAFKHALTQEATYQSILERKRKEFHLQVAQGIEKLYSGRLEEYYEELAEHYSKSDDEKALEYLIKAGDKSKAIYANQQAIGYYTRAMNIVNQFPEKTEQKLSIFEGFGDVYNIITKFDEAIQSYESALEYSKDNRKRADIYRKIADVYGTKIQPDLLLKYVDIAIEELGEDTQSVEMARIYNTAMWMYKHIVWSGHDYDKALDYGLKALSIVEGTEHKRELAEAYNALGDTHAVKGDYDKAMQYQQKALAIAQEMGDVGLLVGIHWEISWAYLAKAGRNFDVKLAVEQFKECIELYKKTGSIAGMAMGYMFVGSIYHNFAKDYESAIKYYKASIEIDEERKFPVSTGRALVYLSRIYRDKGDWDESIKHAEEALHIGMTVGVHDPWIALWACQELIQEAYLAKGELEKALYYIKESMNLSDLSNNTALAKYLGPVEEIFEKMGNHAEFISFCHEIMEKNAEKLKEMKLIQWYLECKELSKQFTQTTFSDEFDGSTLCPEWQWINPRGDCSYELNSESSWLEIRAAFGCDLWQDNFNAPRLLQEISDDFAIETKIASADEKTPAVGGLLVWKDKDNFIRFEKGMRGKNNFELSGSVNGKLNHFGRGMLLSKTIYMRIECIGDILSSYCSSDGENWLTCGEVNFPVDDSIQIGIHAIGSTGSESTATATRFDYFRVQRRTS
jgi:predicted ATPase/class 3 adenylate cyclase/regulation of enolase protein 1 (concanavalin A-like superfamily)